MKRRTFVKTFLLASGALILDSQRFIYSANDRKTIKISMIYNNVGELEVFNSEWGLSLWIEDNDGAVLFDTGGNSLILWNNVESSGIDIRKLSKIIISHNHWDHISGLPIILEKTDYKPDVFVPMADLEPISMENPKAKLIGVKEPIMINEYLWSTGQLEGSTVNGPIQEQSIIIIRDGSLFLLTGCSHPGIVKIVETTKKIHPDKKVNMIIGGLHLLQNTTLQIKKISAELKRLQVNKIAPSHCTGERAMKIFKNEWKNNCIDYHIGNTMRT